jgi:hypothetical protein
MTAPTVDRETGEIRHDTRPRLGECRQGWIWDGTGWRKHRRELPSPIEVQAKFDLLDDLVKEQSEEWSRLAKAAAQTRVAYERAKAEAFLRAEGPMDVRKKIADLETADLLLAAETANIIADTAKNEMWRLKTMQESNRSTNATVNQEMRLAGQGQT